ncbi:MAG: alpha-amylase [Saprospiraceae bacterium]|nr:alpha-amylase [Candidatus Opimibacter skivensis]
MKQPRYPSLYQVNTRTWLTELSIKPGSAATLDDIPDRALDEFKEMGFDWIWFLSVWCTGEQGQIISRTNPVWRQEFEETLSDLKEEDIGGSGFAITDYHVHPDLGGDEALKRLRERLTARGLKLMLDFVPNHMGPDHPWVSEHPEYFISGTVDDLQNNPQNFTKITTQQGEHILAYGRDPYFDGWPDTVQLDYSNLSVIEAMKNELVRIAGQCDGVRCDMAMLMLPDVFEKTWGRKAKSFWPEAIMAARQQYPGFCLMAEVYWDMEWTLQQLGFDYTYDKRLYDRLVEGHAKPVREHFLAELDYQDKLVRFLENHDETRIAATLDRPQHEAAAVITFLSPGLRFFHQGQLEGMRKKISPHLIRGPKETVEEGIQKFYTSLLAVLKLPMFRDGRWQLLESTTAWEENNTWESFISFAWEGADRELTLVVINYAPHDGQCYLKIPMMEKGFGHWELKDIMNPVTYSRDSHDLLARGLYLGMKPWQYHVFEVRK